MGIVAQRIWLQNRAQTLSLPISTAAAVVGAVKLAQGIAQGVSQAIGFHDVLSETSAGDASDSLEQLTQSIQQRLSDSGIQVNQELPIRITEDGQLRVDGDHPRAAEIEAVLNSDRQITESAKRLTAPGSVSGLTIPIDKGNIMDSPGGYPNW